MSDAKPKRPIISVIVLNYNGMQWLPRCFESLEKQTAFDRLEVIVTDNKSADGSDKYAAEWLARTGRGRVVQNGENLFYCGANNNGAAAASGEFVLFLNNDTWLEPACLENLYHGTVAAGADGASPLVQDYDDDHFQNAGSNGIDLFGMTSEMGRPAGPREIFASPGCSILIKTDMFRKIGGFAKELLIYCDETDISWRVWIAGGKLVYVPDAIVHHRGAAVANPAGGTKHVESRTTDFKRFLANRNGVLFLLKNCHSFLLLLLIPHLLLLTVEAFVSLFVVRRWSHVRKSYIGAVMAAFQMMPHVREWRKRIKGFRVHGDFWMLRFIRLKPGRWGEVERMFQFGAPKVDNK